MAVQDFSISSGLAMEILQFCTEPSIYFPLASNLDIVSARVVQIDKIATILQIAFSKCLPLTNYLYFDSNISDIYFKGSNKQQISIGSDRGLAPAKRQANFWTHDGLAPRRMLALFGLNELR